MQQIQLFGYPVGLYKIDAPEVVDRMVAEIEEDEERSNGVQISNRGGWQSTKAFFESDRPSVAFLRTRIFDAFEEFLTAVYGTTLPRSSFSIETWANVNYRGHSNASHDHTAHDNHWSGILYLRTGENGDSPSGVTVFENRLLSGDGRFIASTPVHQRLVGEQASYFELVPEVGKLVFFPGTLRHHVRPYQGTEKRITIAFNIRVKELTNHAFDRESLKARFLSYMWINFRGFMRIGSRVRRTLF